MDFLKIGLIGLGGYVAYNYYKKRKTNAITEKAILSTSTAPIIVDAELQEEGEGTFGGTSTLVDSWANAGGAGSSSGCDSLPPDKCKQQCEPTYGTFNPNGQNGNGSCDNMHSAGFNPNGGVKPIRRSRMASRPSVGATRKFSRADGWDSDTISTGL
jgi:hypothetical protein